uniref:LIM domain-containing protein 1 n=2 Tax=Anthurium amnicola TaxID=1678845 RepID=A0A1D1XR98_9ARAE
MEEENSPGMDQRVPMPFEVDWRMGNRSARAKLPEEESRSCYRLQRDFESRGDGEPMLLPNHSTQSQVPHKPGQMHQYFQLSRNGDAPLPHQSFPQQFPPAGYHQFAGSMDEARSHGGLSLALGGDRQHQQPQRQPGWGGSGWPPMAATAASPQLFSTTAAASSGFPPQTIGCRRMGTTTPS